LYYIKNQTLILDLIILFETSRSFYSAGGEDNLQRNFAAKQSNVDFSGHRPFMEQGVKKYEQYKFVAKVKFDFVWGFDFHTEVLPSKQ
jgi:hypothetical protein